MKEINLRIILTLIVCFSFLLTMSCLDAAMNTNTANTSGNTGNFANASNSVNSAQTANTNGVIPTNVAADTKPSPIKNGNASTGNVTNVNTKPTPPPTPSPTEDPKQNDSGKKDEGMFSFPPPKPTTYLTKEIVNNPGEQIILEQYVAKIRNALIENGHPEDRLVYFSHKREFALVTGLERIDENGMPLAQSRWSEKIPTAGGIGEYFTYLFYGKRILYRFTAFVITEENINPRRGQIPEFETAKNWIEKGAASTDDLTVGGQTPQTFTLDKNFKCFVLIYNFEKHVGAGKEVFLRDFVSAKNQLDVTGIAF